MVHIVFINCFTFMLNTRTRLSFLLTQKDGVETAFKKVALALGSD